MPQPHQAQVAVQATGLCGSDCEQVSLLCTKQVLTVTFQYTTTCTDAMATLLSRLPSFLATKLLAS